MKFNMVTFKVGKGLKTEFTAINPEILPWLKRNEYKYYPFDDYDEIDAIFAKSQAEANVIYKYKLIDK